MIEVKDLVKNYGDHTAVDKLSFTVESGKIYGFLGPNGAGKSTTMNIITGCLAATEGTVTIGGYDIFEEPAKAKKLIGYLPEQPPIYMDMTPYEFLLFVAKAKDVPRVQLYDQVESVIEMTGLGDVRNRLIKNLSKGYKQRVGIAQALLGQPEVIILDEPTVGLDPKQIIEIRDLIKELGKKHTVILSSHILTEVRAVCDIIIIISGGKLVANDTPENLERLFAGTTTMTMTVRASEEKARALIETIDGVKEFAYTQCANGVNGDVSFTYDGDAELAEQVFFAFCDARLPILRMNDTKATLEDIFIELTEDKQDEADEQIEQEQEETTDDSDI